MQQNTTLDMATETKLQLLDRLLRECYTPNTTHSQIYSLNSTDTNEGGLWCPRTFDGFACWDETPATATVYQPCPDFVIGFDPKRYAYKRCESHGFYNLSIQLIKELKFSFMEIQKLSVGVTTPAKKKKVLDIMNRIQVLPGRRIKYIIHGRDDLVGYIQDKSNKCMANGTWFLHPEGNKPWTNYTTCVDIEDLGFRSIVNSIYVIGYSVSVAALILSIGIFLYFRSLQCTRIRIHIHLFMAFALNNILWIVWYKTVVDRVSVVQNNETWCQVLHVITNYFMVTSYIWMFCEGLHLHIALVIVFVKDEVAMRWFVVIGWGLPLIIVGVYTAVRYHTPEATVRCWMEQSDTFWIIVVPVLISLFASFVFLVNVVRVLLTKLHPAPNQHTSVATKKAVRATLILIPLFGLHFVLIPLLPAPNTPGERIYQIVSALLTSLQGLCVAVLFCFTNHDVLIVLRASAGRILKRNDGIAMTGLTAGESLMNTRENVV